MTTPHHHKEHLMRDLDQSDVDRDADNQRTLYLEALYRDLEVRPLAELDSLTYSLGILAREGNSYSIEALVMVGNIRLGHIATSLCEGCLSRTGCDMCNPPDFDFGEDPFYDDAFYASEGRPRFPNEY